MRNLLSLIVVLAAPVTAEPMKAPERQRLIAHLEMTGQWLAGELRGLSANQEKYRPAPAAWSIADVVDHLAVAEPQYWQTLKDSLKNPAPEAGAVNDAGILWYGIDRTQRNRTAEAREPKGQFASAAAAFASFRKLRSEMLEYTRTTEDDLRAHRYLESKMDLYQWLLMISTHSQRHILQIREIKASAGYPKE